MARAALLFVSLLLVLAGCGASLADVTKLGEDLEAEGYDVAGLHHNTMNGHSVLSIEAVRPNEIPAEEDADEIAELAWQQFGGDIDELRVTINAQPMLTATADELTARFGERPAQSRPESDSDGPNSVHIFLIVVVVVVVAGLLLLVWLLGRRRRPPPMAPPPYYYPPPFQQYPPQPPQPPQYRQSG